MANGRSGMGATVSADTGVMNGQIASLLGVSDTENRNRTKEFWVFKGKDALTGTRTESERKNFGGGGRQEDARGEAVMEKSLER